MSLCLCLCLSVSLSLWWQTLCFSVSLSFWSFSVYISGRLCFSVSLWVSVSLSLADTVFVSLYLYFCSVFLCLYLWETVFAALSLAALFLCLHLWQTLSLSVCLCLSAWPSSSHPCSFTPSPPGGVSASPHHPTLADQNLLCFPLPRVSEPALGKGTSSLHKQDLSRSLSHLLLQCLVLLIAFFSPQTRCLSFDGSSWQPWLPAPRCTPIPGSLTAFFPSAYHGWWVSSGPSAWPSFHITPHQLQEPASLLQRILSSMYWGLRSHRSPDVLLRPELKSCWW